MQANVNGSLSPTATQDNRSTQDHHHHQHHHHLLQQQQQQHQSWPATAPPSMIGVPSALYDPDHQGLTAEASTEAYNQWMAQHAFNTSNQPYVPNASYQQQLYELQQQYARDHQQQQAFFNTLATTAAPSSRENSDYTGTPSSLHGTFHTTSSPEQQQQQHYFMTPVVPNAPYHFEMKPSSTSPTSYHSPDLFTGSPDGSISPTSIIPSYTNVEGKNTSPPPPPPKPTTSRKNTSSKRAPAKPQAQAAPTASTSNGKQPAARKRARKSKESTAAANTYESDSDDDAQDTAPRPPPTNGRLPGACTYCKQLKMKCEFAGESVCKRCKLGGRHCIVEGRKQRQTPNKREYLMAQLRQREAMINLLIKQLHSPYSSIPFSVAAHQRDGSPSDRNETGVHDWLEMTKKAVKTSPQYLSPTSGLNDQHSDQSNSGDENYSTAEEEEDPNESTLPGQTAPFGLLANLSLNHPKSKKNGSKRGSVASYEDDGNDDNVGVANDAYFSPGPGTDRKIRYELIGKHQSIPDIVHFGVVDKDDVEKLFEIFYHRINPFIGLLDQKLHTPDMTFFRCPFLFTVVCAVSSRYYERDGRSDMYGIAMHFAKHSAAMALIDGWKTVELCQAYILLSIYAVPAKRWEEDRSWLYTGLAIRLATDLNLHLPVVNKKTLTEQQEREQLNRTRVWMICSNLDRSTATQFGKPSTIKEDYINRHSQDWYTMSAYNHPYDVGLCAYAMLLRVVAKFHAVIFSDPGSHTGLNVHVDFLSVTLEHDQMLSVYNEEWKVRFKNATDPEDRGSMFRTTLLPFLVAYNRLVMWSFGFEQAYQRGLTPSDEIFFTKCYNAAKAVITNMVDNLAPSGYMRYSPDGHFIFTSFASAFLLKLLRPEFRHLLNVELENEIFELIDRVRKTLESDEIAIDERHTPKLYARFLKGLLMKVKKRSVTGGKEKQSQPPPSGHAGDSNNQMDFTPDNAFNASSMNGQPGSNGSGPSASQYQPRRNGRQQTTGGDSEVSISVEGPEVQSAQQYSPQQEQQPRQDWPFIMDSFDWQMPNPIPQNEMLAPMMAVQNSWNTFLLPGFRSEPDQHGHVPAPQPFGGFQMTDPMR